jgi:hypothetical protein
VLRSHRHAEYWQIVCVTSLLQRKRSCCLQNVWFIARAFKISLATTVIPCLCYGFTYNFVWIILLLSICGFELTYFHSFRSRYSWKRAETISNKRKGANMAENKNYNFLWERVYFHVRFITFTLSGSRKHSQYYIYSNCGMSFIQRHWKSYTYLGFLSVLMKNGGKAPHILNICLLTCEWSALNNSNLQKALIRRMRNMRLSRKIRDKE